MNDRPKKNDKNDFRFYFGLLYLWLVRSYTFSQNYEFIKLFFSSRLCFFSCKSSFFTYAENVKAHFYLWTQLFAREVYHETARVSTIFTFASSITIWTIDSRSRLEFFKFHFLTISNVNNCTRNKGSISCSKLPRVNGSSNAKELFRVSNIILLYAASGKRNCLNLLL